uniref:cellulase n=1 Tax=Kalmanozyma brasiliensis (strain GHG001) TaxID=1365824 RepID=V5EYA2_KALBG
MGIKIRPTFLVTLAAILACFTTTSLAYNKPTGPFATHYEDCCRPAFSYDHPKAGFYNAVDTCEKDGVTLIPPSAQLSGRNGCDGGNQFVCSCIQSWVDTVDPTLAYGYGAYNIHDPDGTIENTCWLVEFLPQDPNGKTMQVRKMILQNINTSQGIPKGSWDMALAGGGVGDFNKGCVNQWGTDWGKRYGGVANEKDCCAMPEGLRSSCLFRFRFLGENPGLAGTPKRVRCTTGLIDRSGAQRKDDASVQPYEGKTDKTGHPAPDRYQRNRSVCQNVDPLGIVSAVCGGGKDGGGRLPKGYGMTRQDSHGGSVPDVPGSSTSNGAGAGDEGYGSAPDGGSGAEPDVSGTATMPGEGAEGYGAPPDSGAAPGEPGSSTMPGAGAGADGSGSAPDVGGGAEPYVPEPYVPGSFKTPGRGAEGQRD